jgi:hypothetical protein
VLYNPKEYSAFEGALERSGGPSGEPGVWFDPAVVDDERWRARWNGIGDVEVRVTPTRIVLVRKDTRTL